MLRSLGFLVVTAFFLSLDLYTKSFDVIDVLIVITFGYAVSIELSTFVGSRGRLYTEAGASSMEDVARRVEETLDRKFFTYRKRKLPFFLRSNTLKVHWRYSLENTDITVKLVEGRERTFVCVGPVNDVTEVQVRALAIELAKALAGTAAGSEG